MKDIKYAGVVVTYNPQEDVINNINTYIKWIKRLYIIDNSRNDDFRKYINNEKIEYIPNFENLGIAVALNMAAQRAINDGFDWILTMDQDSKFKKNDLQKLQEYIKNNNTDNIGIVTAYQCSKFTTKDSIPNEEMSKVKITMTSGNLLNLKVFQRIGGFREDFFIDGVDTEYCIRLEKNKYNVIRLNTVLLEHNLGDFSVHSFFGKKPLVSNHNYIRRYYIMRNNLYIANIYNDNEYKKIFLRKECKTAIKILFFEKDSLRKIRSMFRGYMDYKRGITGKYPYKEK